MAGSCRLPSYLGGGGGVNATATRSAFAKPLILDVISEQNVLFTRKGKKKRDPLSYTEKHLASNYHSH